MIDLELLKNILKDPHASQAIGKITDIELSKDRSVLRVMVSTWPDEIEMVARVTWDACSSGAGIFMFPQGGDLVLIEYVDDDEDVALVTRRISSTDDLIPVTAADGSTVIKAVPSKRVWLTSDLRLNFSRGDSEPSQNLVLGQIFKTAYIEHLDNLIALIEKLSTQRTTDSAITHLTIGLPSTPPLNSVAMLAEKVELETLKAEVENFKTDKVESEDFLSDLSFTEK